MSDVIQFPLPTEGHSREDLACLTDLTEHPVMSDLYNTTTFSIGKQQAIEPAIQTGWSNQDLADLYRAQRLLALAGIKTEVDQGLTDEGDPWFIFMDTTGEVFVHFSRFDGMYMAASMLQDGPVWADNLHDLVSEFSHKIQPVDEAPGSQTNVVSLANRNTVVIHPAAALAALVWSVYLMSEKLVNAAPAPVQDMPIADTETLSDRTDNADNSAMDLQVLPAEITQKAALLLNESNTAKASDNEHQLRDASLMSQIALLSVNHSATVAGIGLSLVALAFGIPLGGSKDSTDTDNANHALSIDDGFFELASNNQTHVDRETLNTAETGENSSKPVQDIFSQQEASVALETAEAEVEAELAEGLKALASKLNNGSSHESDHTAPPRSDREEDANATDLQNAQQNGTTLVPIGLSDGATTPTTKQLSDDTSILATLDIALNDYKVINLETIEMSNIGKILPLNDDLVTDNILMPSSAAQLESFGDQARKFIDFLLNGDYEITILTTSTEVIFVDANAIGDANKDQPIHTISWSLDDGGIISTVGLKSDFHSFDLIA